MTSELLEAALLYASIGWRVFPLIPRGKSPAIKGWQEKATTDEAQIRAWWAEKDYNIGVATGNGLCVVDVDDKPKNDVLGSDMLREWEIEHGDISETCCAKTGSGGMHYYFDIGNTHISGCQSDTIFIDLRCDGNLIVAPPSIHPNGNRYEWDISPEDMLPAKASAIDKACIQWIHDNRKNSANGTCDVPEETIREGEGRNIYLFSFGCSLRAKNADKEMVRATLEILNERVCVPPLPNAELQTLVASVCKYPQGRDSALKLPPWSAARAENPPKLNPVLIPDILRRGCVAALAGERKIGKTIAAVELCCAVAGGGEWFGKRIEGGGKCLFIDPEIQPSELANRFARVARAMDIDASVIDARVSCWSLRGATTPSGKPATISDVAHDIEIRCERGDFDLVVVDSASALLEGNESDSVDVRRFFAHVLRISQAANAAVLLVLHYGKGNAGDRHVADRARGSSVWADAPEAALTLTELKPKSGEPSDYLESGEYACILEAGGLRSFSRFEPVRVIFHYPKANDTPPVTPHRVDVDGITDDWAIETSAGAGGRNSGESRKMKAELRAASCMQAIAAEFIASGLGRDGMPASDAAALVSDALGETVNTSTLKKYTADSDIFAVYQINKKRWKIVPMRPPRDPPPQLLE